MAWVAEWSSSFEAATFEDGACMRAVGARAWCVPSVLRTVVRTSGVATDDGRRVESSPKDVAFVLATYVQLGTTCERRVRPAVV